jgi:hypothetical protein
VANKELWQPAITGQKVSSASALSVRFWITVVRIKYYQNSDIHATSWRLTTPLYSNSDLLREQRNHLQTFVECC